MKNSGDTYKIIFILVLILRTDFRLLGNIKLKNTQVFNLTKKL